MVSAVVPPFVRVATFCPPMPPTGTDTQFRLVGLTDPLPEVDDDPVPLSATVCGLFVAESVKLSVALRAPDAVGLNTTEAPHVPAAARLVPQVLLEMLKSEGFVPEIATALMVIDELVPFASVNDFAALLVPTVTVP